VKRGVGDLAPITLDGINVIAELQTRVDRKYIVTPHQTATLIAELPPTVRVLDIDGSREFAYKSVYFDSDDFKLYLDTAHRRRQRYKVRSRTYVGSETTMLEVKTRGGRSTTVKHRLDYSVADAERLTSRGRAFVEESVSRAGAADGLRPTLTTRYRRSTFVDTDSGTRLTCDWGLLCTDWQSRSVTPGFVVLESKSTGGASLFDRWLWNTGVRPAPLSKFCTGLAALHPELPANKWHRTLQRYFPSPAEPR